MDVVSDTLPGAAPPSKVSNPSAFLPAPESVKPNAPPLSGAWQADTTPGNVGRSDDAPFIWKELREHARQFGSLEGQLKSNTERVDLAHTKLVELHCSTQTLATKLDLSVDSLEKTITLAGEAVQGAIESSARESHLKAEGLHGPTMTTVGQVRGELSQVAQDVAGLKTEQTSNAKILKILMVGTPLLGTALCTVLVGAATLMWNYGLYPGLVKSVGDAVRTELDKEKKQEAKMIALERENAELKAAAAKRR